MESIWWWLQIFYWPRPGEMIQFDHYFSDGLVQPPARIFHELDVSFQEISNRTHGPRTPKPEYLMARFVTSWSGSVGIRSHSILTKLLDMFRMLRMPIWIRHGSLGFFPSSYLYRAHLFCFGWKLSLSMYPFWIKMAVICMGIGLYCSSTPSAPFPLKRKGWPF